MSLAHFILLKPEYRDKELWLFMNIIDADMKLSTYFHLQQHSIESNRPWRVFTFYRPEIIKRAFIQKKNCH
jgi:hypothetical protein